MSQVFCCCFCFVLILEPASYYPRGQWHAAGLSLDVWALWSAPRPSEDPVSTGALILGCSLSESILGTGAGPPVHIEMLSFSPTPNHVDSRLAFFFFSPGYAGITLGLGQLGKQRKLDAFPAFPDVTVWGSLQLWEVSVDPSSW